MRAQFTIKNGLFGDSCLPEPAINAYGLRNGGTVNVHVANPIIAQLYEHHPVIRLVDEPGGPVMDELQAFWRAVSNNRYFAEGFWEQVGLDWPSPDERIHFRVYGLPRDDHPFDIIALCPFSRSCDGNKGCRPNKTVPVAWWEDIISRVGPLHEKCSGNPARWYSFGSNTDPPIQGTENIRGLPPMTVVRMILRARLLVTVDTWANILSADKQANGLGRTLLMGGVLPLYFIQPPGSEVVFDPWPDQWNKDETVEKIQRLWVET